MQKKDGEKAMNENKISESFWERLKWYGVFFGISVGKVIYIEVNNLSHSQANFFTLIALFIFVIALSDFLFQLYKVNRIVFYRLLATISAVWLLLMSVKFRITKQYGHIDSFLIVGVIPLVIIWGTLWATKDIGKSKRIDDE